MSWIRSLGLRTGFAGRLQLAGLLIAAGIVVELGTLFWNHPISLFLFLVSVRSSRGEHSVVRIVWGVW